MAYFFDNEPKQPGFRQPLGIADLNANIVNAYTAADSLNLKPAVSHALQADVNPTDSA
jgi:hypothetical protein